MRPHSMRSMVPPMGRDRIDWLAIRDQVDLARVATAVMGEASGRRGERGRRLWWRCPFHDDKPPSFCIEPGKPWWRCFGCGEHGDAASLVMRINRVAFPEAVKIVAELAGIVTSSRGSPRPRPPAKPAAIQPEKPPARPPEGSSGLPWPMRWRLFPRPVRGSGRPRGPKPWATYVVAV
jgi:hypothetical protein